VVLSLFAVGVWGVQSFGEIENVGRTTRIVIVAVTALAIGVQTVLASFFFSILGMRRR
jgi:hypothetical protein